MKKGRSGASPISLYWSHVYVVIPVLLLQDLLVNYYFWPIPQEQLWLSYGLGKFSLIQLHRNLVFLVTIRADSQSYAVPKDQDLVTNLDLC